MLAVMHPMPTLFDAMFSDALLDRPLFSCVAAHHSLSGGARAPQVDEKEDEYTITLSVPGIRSEDLAVNIEEGYLKFRGETQTASCTHFANWATHLPKDADAESASASHVDGLLQVKIPKKEPVKTAVAVVENGESTPDDDDDTNYTMRLNCAGIAKADLSLIIEDGLLTISGETKSRGVRLSTRSYRLPDDADEAKAYASYVDGVLTIAVPKKAAAVPMHIKLTLNALAEKAEQIEQPRVEKTIEDVVAADDDEEDGEMIG